MSCMEKYNYDFPCEFNPRLKAKIDYFLGKCSVLDEKDTRLYALANDVLEEELKSFFTMPTKNMEMLYIQNFFKIIVSGNI